MKGVGWWWDRQWGGGCRASKAVIKGEHEFVFWGMVEGGDEGLPKLQS